MRPRHAVDDAGFRRRPSLSPPVGGLPGGEPAPVPSDSWAETEPGSPGDNLGNRGRGSR